MCGVVEIVVNGGVWKEEVVQCATRKETVERA
jgi:hypothetical protein